jgi:hypothetical protein
LSVTLIDRRDLKRGEVAHAYIRRMHRIPDIDGS